MKDKKKNFLTEVVSILHIKDEVAVSNPNQGV